MTEARRAEVVLQRVERIGELLARTGPEPTTLSAVRESLASRMEYQDLAIYLGDTELRLP